MRWAPRRPGRRKNVRAAALAAAETGSPSPTQALRLDARPFGSGRARSSSATAAASRLGSRLGGRAAKSRHSLSSFAAGPSSSPTVKRRSRSAPSSALRRRSLAAAAALFSARRERSAPAEGGSRRREASSNASPAPAKNRSSPCPAARPRPGGNRCGRQRRKGLSDQGVRGFPRRSRVPEARRTQRRSRGSCD